MKKRTLMTGIAINYILFQSTDVIEIVGLIIKGLKKTIEHA